MTDLKEINEILDMISNLKVELERDILFYNRYKNNSYLDKIKKLKFRIQSLKSNLAIMQEKNLNVLMNMCNGNYNLKYAYLSKWSEASNEELAKEFIDEDNFKKKFGINFSEFRVKAEDESVKLIGELCQSGEINSLKEPKTKKEYNYSLFVLEAFSKFLHKVELKKAQKEMENKHPKLN